MTTARDVIEYMAAGMYGKNWNSDDPEKRPGERMKDVWREYARDALGGALSAPDSVRQELAALLNPWRPQWRHKKRGSEYAVVGEAELQCAQDVIEGRELVIYRAKDGKLWAR